MKLKHVVAIFLAVTTVAVGDVHAECGKKFFGIETCASFAETARKLEATYGPGKSGAIGCAFIGELAGAVNLSPGADMFMLLGNTDLGVVGVRIGWTFSQMDAILYCDETLEQIERNITSKYGEPFKEHNWINPATQSGITCEVAVNNGTKMIMCSLFDVQRMITLMTAAEEESGF